MKVRTYLSCGGNCVDAFRFDEKHLGSMIMTFDQLPGATTVSPEQAKVSCTQASPLATLRSWPATARPFAFKFNGDRDADAERIYKILTEGGEVFTTMQETFVATRYEQFRDKSGTSWVVLHEKSMGTPQS